MFNIKKIFAFVLVFLSSTAYALLPPTVSKNGRWEGLSSFQIADAEIDDRNEKVCLPKLVFKEEVDKAKLEQTVRDGFKSQEAVFQLYHDGLGRPKKVNGYYYASDVFLKELNKTYTGYLREQGFKFKVSNTPAYNDTEYIKEITGIDNDAPKEKPGSKSNLRVCTVYDVLPKGVIPPSIRSEQAKIAAIVASLKSRPYKTEIIQIDPLRWASGFMGTLNEKGEIDMASCESQLVDMVIRVPDKAGWLTPQMLEEIKKTPCEFVLSRYKNGLEVIEGTRYLLHDIYFKKLKLTWEEWLEKHGLKCPEFVEKPEYADGVVPIEIHTVDGIFKSLDAVSICQINFTQKSNLVYPQEIMRVFPPNPRPKDRNKTLRFLKAYTETYRGKSVNVHIMVCPDGKSYTELGQKRIKRMMFNDTFKNFDDTEQDILKSIGN